MISSNANSLDYQERAVAFIDILGFADQVKASATDATARGKLTRLVTIYKVFDWFVTDMLERLAEGSFFSDTFVLSAALDQTFYLIRETGNLCRFLLLQGFPCRGAITAGLLHHHQQIMIGPALVDAYRAEQSIAIYPRIVVDDATMCIWADECTQGSAHSDLKDLIREDFDGQFYLDILDPQWSVFFPWVDSSGIELVPSDPAQFITAASERIREGLNASGRDSKVRAKYRWLAMKCHVAARGLRP